VVRGVAWMMAWAVAGGAHANEAVDVSLQLVNSVRVEGVPEGPMRMAYGCAARATALTPQAWEQSDGFWVQVASCGATAEGEPPPEPVALAMARYVRGAQEGVVTDARGRVLQGPEVALASWVPLLPQTVPEGIAVVGWDALVGNALQLGPGAQVEVLSARPVQEGGGCRTDLQVRLHLPLHQEGMGPWVGGGPMAVQYDCGTRQLRGLTGELPFHGDLPGLPDAIQGQIEVRLVVDWLDQEPPKVKPPKTQRAKTKRR